jgi:hypothetical protein
MKSKRPVILLNGKDQKTNLKVAKEKLELNLVILHA